MRKRLFRYKSLRWILSATVLSWGLVVLTAILPTPPQGFDAAPPQKLSSILQPQAALAQRFDVDGAWRQVYEQLPDLPLENQYISQDTGNVAEDNTLIGRLIRYHIYVKGRPPSFRLDWKLTLADYLGVNERMIASTYPSADTLQTNPMDGDITAIQSLNRSQRDDLVQALVDIFGSAFTPSEADTPEVPSELPSEASPSTSPSRTPPRAPQPGDAELLLP